MIFANPINCVRDIILAHRTRIGSIEVNRGAPIGVIAIGKKVLRKLAQIVSVRSQMVVHHIENHAQTQRMRAINKSTKVIGAAIESRRRKEIYAIVAPAETARKIGDRHYLDQGDAAISEFG